MGRSKAGNREAGKTYYQRVDPKLLLSISSNDQSSSSIRNGSMGAPVFGRKSSPPRCEIGMQAISHSQGRSKSRRQCQETYECLSLMRSMAWAHQHLVVHRSQPGPRPSKSMARILWADVSTPSHNWNVKYFAWNQCRHQLEFWVSRQMLALLHQAREI